MRAWCEQVIDKADPQRWLGDAVKSLVSKMEAKDWEVNCVLFGCEGFGTDQRR